MLNALELPPRAVQLLDRLGGPRRAAILAVGVGSVAVILGLARWATAPTWVPVYSNLPLESIGVITERLDEERIAFRLEGGGSELRVPANDLARARVALAREGMPLAGRPGLELFDQPAWGMTDFTQRVNYRRALEGELERTIGKMRGVEAVKVHVSMEEAAGFRRAGRPSEASVVLRLRSGSQPSQEMVLGIAHLVASSIDGVQAERVMVLDDRGRLLSSPYEVDSPAAFASRDLKMRGEVEQYLATKAEQLVAQMVGAGNVRVQVSAEINLDRVERTVETVDPDRQVLSSEQRSEIVPGADGGAGSTSVTATYLNTRSLETFSGAVGNVKRMTAAVLINDRLVVEGGVARYEARAAEELARIQALAATAMGIDPSRGDMISVVSFPFDGSLRIDDVPSAWTLVLGYHRPAIALVALLLTFLIALRITRTLQAQAEQLAGGDAAGKGRKLDLLAGAEAGPELVAAPAEVALPPPGPTTRELVAAQIESDPEVAVKMIRAWMKED
jgi:flagellar M-ring protein FliF